MWNDFTKQLVLKDLLEKKEENIDFAYISKHRYLTEDIMLHYVRLLRFEDIVCRQPISEKILELAVEAKLNRGENIQCFVNQIVAYQNVSKGFTNKYSNHIDIDELNRKVGMYRESFVNVMAYLENCKDSKRKPRKLESILYKILFNENGIFLSADELPTNEYTVYLDTFELYEGFEYENRLRVVANKIYKCEEELDYCATKREEKLTLTTEKLAEMGLLV